MTMERVPIAWRSSSASVVVFEPASFIFPNEHKFSWHIKRTEQANNVTWRQFLFVAVQNNGVSTKRKARRCVAAFAPCSHLKLHL